MSKTKKPKRMGPPLMYDHEKKADINRFERLLKNYFEKCKDDGRPYSVTGLALALKMCDKSVLYDYRDRYEPFASMVKQAILMVENQHEESLSTRHSCTGNIFALKNMGWSDKQEIETNLRGDIVICTGVPTPQSEDE